MRAHVTRRTLESGHLDGSSAPEGMNFVMDEPQVDGDQIVIHVRAFLIGAPEGTAPAMEMPCLMTQEDGQWKFDLAGTGDRMMAGSGEAAGQVITAVSEAAGRKTPQPQRPRKRTAKPWRK